MANEFIERLEKNRNEEIKAQQLNPKFGGVFKTSLPPELVKHINQVEKLTPEERQMLLVAKTMLSEKHLKSIQLNVLFFFWMFIISAVLGVILVLTAK
ncbi:hypothetical protein CAPN006_01500 [Capnocytophaga canimorsus]|uniref:hypothetical protein n=1 Tax=Capnocytophaga canimorsus TaxID=28188 RepID=UPI001ACBB9BE|nr:hypothetical protein [Capnocytophaga canimorsus]GIM55756.1 hypothetical protein CAPN006_01500 [Capnocytophaga canimorsus]